MEEFNPNKFSEKNEKQNTGKTLRDFYNGKLNRKQTFNIAVVLLIGCLALFVFCLIHLFRNFGLI